MFTEEKQKISFSSKHPATPHCYDLLKRSLIAADIQIKRIWEDPTKKINPHDPTQVHDHILIDLHFYFISLRNIYRYMKKIVEDPTYSDLQSELEVLNDRWFKHYSSAREAFEHIDQRFPGEKHEHKIVEIEENGAKRKVHYGLQMRNGLFLHSDKKWDISHGTFLVIKSDVQKFLKLVTDSSRKSYYQ
jgi:hypothetical protein